MKFTVAIPCYKQSQYLEGCIDSVYQQTLKDFELIVVNDGSPDDAQKIIENTGCRWVKQINKGLASARNAAIMNMRGDYFFPLDADDMMAPFCLEKISRKIDESSADVIAPSITCFNEKGDTQSTIIMENPTIDDFKEGNRLAYCSAIKKEALLECGGYSPRMDMLGGWEDLSLWYDLMTRGKRIVTIQEPLVMYRVKEKSMWKYALKYKDSLWDQIIKDFPQVASHRK